LDEDNGLKDAWVKIKPKLVDIINQLKDNDMQLKDLDLAALEKIDHAVVG
jgi:hypothetical protein